MAQHIDNPSPQQKIDELERANGLLRMQGKILELIALGSSLSTILQTLCKLVEQLSDGNIRSTLLMHRDGENDLTTLPEELSQEPIEEGGSSVAYLGKIVQVSEVVDDPHWKSFVAVSQKAGIEAHWFWPFYAHDKQPIGMFAIEWRGEGNLDPYHDELMKAAAHLAGIAAERRRFEQRQQHIVTSSIKSEMEKEQATVLTQSDLEIRRKNEELERFHQLSIDREWDLVKLKKEINSLLKKLGLPIKYKVEVRPERASSYKRVAPNRQPAIKKHVPGGD